MISDLINYLELEKKIIEEEIELLKILSEDQLIKLGLLIPNCIVIKIINTEVRLKCGENYSKIKTGDTVSLIHGKKVFKATIIENMVDTIDLTVNDNSDLKINSVIDLKIEKVNLIEPVIAAIKNIRPGKPGYFFYETAIGIKNPIDSMKGSLSEEAINSIITKSYPSLDKNQKEILSDCLKKPSLYVVQGPPGTGKTKILSTVAHELCKNNLRVAILAPTHKAVNNCLNEISNNFSERELFKIGEELKSEGLNLKKINTLSYYDFKKLLKKRKVSKNVIIGLTFYSAILNLGLKSDSFGPNVILIDEAAQIPLAYGIVSGLFGAGSVILFGDDAQMPPIFQTELKNNKLSLSLYSQIKLSHPKCIRSLNTTYRLNKDICKVIGSLYYRTIKGSVFLKSSPYSKNNKIHVDLEQIKTNFIKELLNPEESLVYVTNDEINKSIDYNNSEAEFIAKILFELNLIGYKFNDIAVVTPFRKQSILIKNKIKKLLPEQIELPIIDTVEKVQGSSVEIVIISYAINEYKSIKQMNEFLFSPNRLNVSISRAKSKVIIFASENMRLVEKEMNLKNQFEYLHKNSNNFNLVNLLNS